MFEIEKELIEKLANYLATKPWFEVQALLTELQKLKPIQEKKEDVSGS
jgi:hypothetical protein